jgi:hypothetical protein
MTIVPVTNEDAPWLWFQSDTADWPGHSQLHCIPVLAWQVDGERVLPITAMGRAEPGGAWAIANGGIGRYVTSDGDLVSDQGVIREWLRRRYVELS